MHKKVISTIALGLIIGASTISVNANPKLSDVNGHWANKEIQQFISNGFINGYEDGTFKPDNSITRAEFVKIANKYFGFTAKGSENFSDVNPGDWFYNDICIAQKEGYIDGYGDGTFKPDKTITREEAAKIIISIKNREDTKIDKLNNFADGNMVSDWAKKYVEGAIERGYIKGDDKGKINPLSNITRAESVSMLSRVVNEAPVVVIHNPVIELNIGDKWDNNMIDFDATDKEDQEPKALEISFKHNVDTSKAGEYSATVYAKDLEGAVGSATCKVIVKEAPAENYNPNGSEFKNAVTSQMVTLVNQHRVANGKVTLSSNGRLNTSANAWSKYMADNGFFDHTDGSGNGVEQVFPQYAPVSGENIAATQLIVTGDMQQDAHNLANELFAMWKKSSGHNATMLRSYYRIFGFGLHAVKTSDGVYSIYATQHFGTGSTEPGAPQDEVK